MGESATTGETKQEPPITVESLLDIWKNHKIIPMLFKPTGEIVYVTPEVADAIDKHNNKNCTQEMRQDDPL